MRQSQEIEKEYNDLLIFLSKQDKKLAEVERKSRDNLLTLSLKSEKEARLLYSKLCPHCQALFKGDTKKINEVRNVND